jgi:hypothetical protein
MGQSCTSRSANSCNLLLVRQYEVQPGDSPASIAAAHAGCPKCARDLIGVNAHKETVTYPNGFVTFKELRRGEKLNLPDKWWTKEFDELPPAYFAALPYADGVTPGKGIGVGGAPYSAALVAAAKAADAALEPGGYCTEVARVGSAVNSAVHAFKVIWNAEQSPKVPINTGNYEIQTAEAMYQVLGEAFEPCATRTATTPRAPQPTTTPTRVAPKKEGISAGQVVGVALLGAGAVAGAIYLVTK